MFTTSYLSKYPKQVWDAANIINGRLGTLKLNCPQSVNVGKFSLYILTMGLLPFLFYRKCIEWFKWTQIGTDTSVTHAFSSFTRWCLMLGMYWIVGNGAATYDWTMPIVTCLASVVYGTLSEREDMRYDLNQVRKWSSTMVSVIAILIVLIAIMAVYHIRLAKRNNMLLCYLLALILPIIMVLITYFVAYIQNEAPAATQPYKVQVHLHHADIFYILAFFARFPTVVSRLMADTFLGFSLQGMVAFGADPTFIPTLKNPNEEWVLVDRRQITGPYKYYKQ